MAIDDVDIDKILRMGGQTLNRARQGSIQWFMRTVRGIRKEEDVKSKSLTGLITKGPELQGQMVAFSYDPKLKDVLPYYDKYPLVIPLSVDARSMLGLNLHYLPPRVRLAFIGALKEYFMEKDGQKKLKISYNIVKGAQQLSAYAPCIKRYLFPHVRSKFVQVDYRDWDKATLLPLARFIGANEENVWADSMSGRRPKRRN